MRAHLVFFLVVWPALTIFTSTADALRIPYFLLSVRQAFTAAVLGVLLLLPDIVLTAFAAAAVSMCIFNRLGATSADDRAWTFRKTAFEPVLMWVALVLGIVVWYPGVSSQTLFFFMTLGFWEVPAVFIPVLLAILIAAGAWVAARPGLAVRLAVTLVLVGVLAPVPGLLRARVAGLFSAPSDLVLLGIDSVSQHDPVEPLRRWTAANGGVWYDRAVAPGLFTNAVWTSVLTMRPVRDHGVFHTFQPFPAEAPLLRAASARGYRTVAMFSDQLTCRVGSEAGFDIDSSGPQGWRQLVLTLIQNNTLLLPVIKPLLPRSWPSAAPPNHAGTFTYDLERTIREILTARDSPQPVLVAAHLIYLHEPVYPRYVDLTWPEIRRVLLAPAVSLYDRSFFWQDEDRPTDPIPLRRWKLDRLQRAIISSVAKTRFLERGGRLIAFSDHGDRLGLSADTFADPRYHNVLLATFGVDSRPPDEPISLLDIGTLAGLVNEPKAEPRVEFALTPGIQWPDMMRSARLHWSGAVDLDSERLEEVFRTLKSHGPWASRGGPRRADERHSR